MNERINNFAYMKKDNLIINKKPLANSNNKSKTEFNNVLEAKSRKNNGIDNKKSFDVDKKDSTNQEFVDKNKSLVKENKINKNTSSKDTTSLSDKEKKNTINKNDLQELAIELNGLTNEIPSIELDSIVEKIEKIDQLITELDLDWKDPEILKLVEEISSFLQTINALIPKLASEGIEPRILEMPQDILNTIEGLKLNTKKNEGQTKIDNDDISIANLNSKIDNKSISKNTLNNENYNNNSNSNSNDEKLTKEVAITTEKNMDKDIEAKDGKQSGSDRLMISDNETNKEVITKPKVSETNNQQNKDFEFLNIQNEKVENVRSNNLVNSINTPSENLSKPQNNILNQVIEHAKLSLTDEGSEMLLKLKPESLGNVTMKVIIERGMLIAKFDVESQIVKETLESNLQDLRSALSDKGFEIQQFDVSVNQDSNQHSSNHFLFNNRKKKNNKLVLEDQNSSYNHYDTKQGVSISSHNSTINFLA